MCFLVKGAVKISLINNIYVFCENESFSYDTESSEHPVEKGLPITDHTKRNPIELSLSGRIVNYKNNKSKDIVENLRKLQNSGSLIKYVGRKSVSNMQIQSFEVTYSNETWGGCNFSMSLKEVRIAQPAYNAQKSGIQQVQNGDGNAVYHNVRKGDTIWTLVTTTYKSLYPKYSNIMEKCNWVMSKNQNAFSRRGDFRTLQIGKRILIGYKNRV